MRLSWLPVLAAIVAISASTMMAAAFVDLSTCSADLDVVPTYPSAALIQATRSQSSRPALSLFSLSHTSTDLADSPTGSTASLDEAGYLTVHQLCCPLEMSVYIERYVASRGYKVCAVGGLEGLVHWFSGCDASSTQSFARLNQEIDAALLSTDCPWLGQESTDCPARPNCMVFPASRRRRCRGECSRTSFSDVPHPPGVEKTCTDRCMPGHECCPTSLRCAPLGSCPQPPEDCLEMCKHGFICCGSLANRCIKKGQECPCPTCSTKEVSGQCQAGAQGWDVIAASGNYKCCVVKS